MKKENYQRPIHNYPIEKTKYKGMLKLYRGILKNYVILMYHENLSNHAHLKRTTFKGGNIP